MVINEAIELGKSFGDVATTLSHPASTSHRYASPAERKRQGITDGLIRLSVGIEDVEDIKADIDQALRATA